MMNMEQFVEVTNEKAIVSVYAKNKELVTTEKDKYMTIDVAEAMTKLATCGQLIQLAYAATNRFSCQANVVELLSKYSTMVKDTYLASSRFVIASIESLENYQIALSVVDDDPETALEFISNCSEIAKKLAAEAGALSKQAGKLSDIAEQALIEATKDQSVTDKQRKEMEAKINAAKALSKELEVQSQQLGAAIQSVKEEEAKALKEAKTERDRAFAINLIGAITAPIVESVALYTGAKRMNKKGGGYNKASKDDAKGNDDENDKDSNDDNDDGDDYKAKPVTGKTAADRAYQLTEQKFKLQSKLIDQNAALAKTISELAGFKDSKNTLEQALVSIEIAITTLGRIKVIFGNTRVFWEGVQSNCEALEKNAGIICKLGSKGAAKKMKIIKKKIADGGLSWFTLCVVNYEAKQAIKSVDAQMDGIMSNLPNRQQAIQLVKDLTVEMPQLLAKENKKLEASNDEIKAITN